MDRKKRCAHTRKPEVSQSRRRPVAVGILEERSEVRKYKLSVVRASLDFRHWLTSTLRLTSSAHVGFRSQAQLALEDDDEETKRQLPVVKTTSSCETRSAL